MVLQLQTLRGVVVVVAVVFTATDRLHALDADAQGSCRELLAYLLFDSYGQSSCQLLTYCVTVITCS